MLLLRRVRLGLPAARSAFDQMTVVQQAVEHGPRCHASFLHRVLGCVHLLRGQPQHPNFHSLPASVRFYFGATVKLSSPHRVAALRPHITAPFPIHSLLVDLIYKMVVVGLPFFTVSVCSETDRAVKRAA